jgi:hypothetical protein
MADKKFTPYGEWGLWRNGFGGEHGKVRGEGFAAPWQLKAVWVSAHETDRHVPGCDKEDNCYCSGYSIHTAEDDPKTALVKALFSCTKCKRVNTDLESVICEDCKEKEQ